MQHLQSHDLVNQLLRRAEASVDKMREKLGGVASPGRQNDLAQPSRIERSRAMLDCIAAGIAQIDEASSAPRTDKKSAGSVDLF